MGKTEVLKVLDTEHELTTTEIAELAELSIASVKRIVKSLLTDLTEGIAFRELTREEKLEKYGHTVPARIKVYKIIN